MKRIAAVTLLALTLKAQALTIGAYNIRNFDYDERARIHTDKSVLAQVLKSANADVLSVEEINNTAEFESYIAKTLPGYDVELARCGGEHGQHPGFVFNKKVVELVGFTEDLTIAEPGTPGGCNSGSRPAAIALFKIKATGQQFYGITVHLKSGSDANSMAKRSKQFQVLKNIVNGLKQKGVKDFYIAGDMNTTEYLSRGADYKNLTALTSDLGMTDLASNLKCSAYWWGGTDDGIEAPSLLDHILVTPGLNKKNATANVYGHCAQVSCKAASMAQLGNIYKSVSDHCPIAATVQ